MIKAEAFASQDEKSILSLLLPKFCTFCTCNDALEHGFNVVIEKPMTFH
jgi:predicted dehydrogenase